MGLYRIPDGITPYVGFRLWYWKDGRLKSQTNRGDWSTTGATEAGCHPFGHARPPCDQISPNDDCKYGCGLYAYHDASAIPQAKMESAVKCSVTAVGLTITGAVVGWGRIYRHEDQGWRAQYAKPVAFLLPSPAELERLIGSTAPRVDNKTAPKLVGEVRRAAETLGARTFRSLGEMEDFAPTMGARWWPE